MSVTPPPPEPAGRAEPAPLVDALLRVAGGVVSVVGGVVTGIAELIFAESALEIVLARRSVGALLVGAPLLVAGVLLAVAAAVALSRFAHRTVGSGWALALPALPWFALMAVAAVRTREGDLLLAGNSWLGLVMVVAGAMTYAVMAFRIITASVPGRLGG